MGLWLYRNSYDPVVGQGIEITGFGIVVGGQDMIDVVERKLARECEHFVLEAPKSDPVGFGVCSNDEAAGWANTEVGGSGEGVGDGCRLFEAGAEEAVQSSGRQQVDSAINSQAGGTLGGVGSESEVIGFGREASGVLGMLVDFVGAKEVEV